MKKHFISIYTLIAIGLGSCTSPPDLTPRLRQIFVLPNLESLELKGQNLDPKNVRLAGQVATILEVSSDKTRIKVKPAIALGVGEYDVELTTINDTVIPSNAGVHVLSTQDEVAATELNNPDNLDKSIVRGEAVLTFNPGTNSTELERIVEETGFAIEEKNSPLFPGEPGLAGQHAWELRDTLNRDTIDALNELADKTETFPDLNLKMTLVCGQPPSLESKPLSTNLELQNTPARPQALPDDLFKARVAVLDTGVNANAIFDFGNGSNFIDIAAMRNFTSESDNLDNATQRAPDGTPISSSNVGHGTAVAGLVYSTLSSALGADVVRANADKFIVPVKVCEGKIGRCRALDVALGIYYAINQPNVKVINLSLGNRIGSSLILEALEAAQKKGVTVIVSAGNQGQNPMKPSSFPAAYSVSNASGRVLPDLINVGSIRETATAGGLLREPSAFSSEGTWVDLVANGEELKSSSAAAVDAQGLYTGTSFSAPQVAALAALVQAKNIPAPLSPLEVKTFLLSKANAVANCAKTKCGAGVVDPRSFLK
jgi:Subtilase family